MKNKYKNNHVLCDVLLVIEMFKILITNGGMTCIVFKQFLYYSWQFWLHTILSEEIFTNTRVKYGPFVSMKWPVYSFESACAGLHGALIKLFKGIWYKKERKATCICCYSSICITMYIKWLFFQTFYYHQSFFLN